MKITIHRKGKNVSMKCEGNFLWHNTETYRASTNNFSIPSIRGGMIWFGTEGNAPDWGDAETLEEAKESFKKTKAAALDYQRLLRNKNLNW